MSVLDNIFKRYSCRHFSEKEVDVELLKQLVKAGMAAPSGKDRRPWEFIIVNKRELLDSMAEQLPYAKMLKNAPGAIVVCGIEDEEKGGSPYWFVDCSAATQNILLAAEALELGAVWTATYPYNDRMDAVKATLKVPSHVMPLCVIPIGYPIREARVKDKFNPDRIHINEY